MTDDTNNNNNDNNDNNDTDSNSSSDEGNNLNPDLTQEELTKYHQELQDYRASLEQEFMVTAEKESDPDKIYQGALEFFKKSSPDAVAQVVFLAQSSTSDSVRLNACKYILDSLRRGMVDSPDDPVAEILKNIMAANNTETE